MHISNSSSAIALTCNRFPDQVHDEEASVPSWYFHRYFGVSWEKLGHLMSVSLCSVLCFALLLFFVLIVVVYCGLYILIPRGVFLLYLF